jgi:membrane fusion protein (multidrug efflux system)
VTVAAVRLQDVNPPAEYVGHIEAIEAVRLRARVEGFLEQVNFTEGGYVRAGDLLYVIEQAPYKARVDAAEAQVAQAEAILQKASQRLKRLRAARPESVPATDMDNAVAEELRARAQLEAAKAELEIARINLRYTVIRAPISGRIGKTAYTKGNLVNLSSGPMARIVQVDPVRVVYSVSENDIPVIQEALHDAARGNQSPLLAPRLRLANGQIYKETGRVDFVDNEVDPSTGTIAVRAVFNNPDRLLIPGQYVTVLVKKSKPRIMPVVPQAAVLVNQQGRYVLVVDSENRVVARPIAIGPATGAYWAVESGLKAGEKIIVYGIQKVRPGQKVRIKIGRSEGR